ncbi:hypothetical protein P3T36_006762 [Kitasatospora sp. MAP12-15]|uniref:hypothetical protein n=1 Tax=unclassified Kitasatospora TaxID=2633591 RepID=UPI00247470B8|nr:hypothetical protein [Kitasatospora sp. MAP12-44]MDH6111582.1 hypothetical protein [Kitasatospora sp. MAP12-44]
MTSTTLASLATLRLGGPAGHVLTVSDPADWPEAVRAIGQQQEDAPWCWATAATSSPPTPGTPAPSSQ